jgi:hypothetical protein
MKWILKIKHWQLFLILILPNLFQYSDNGRLLIDILLIVLISVWSIAIIFYGRLNNREIKNSSFYYSYCILILFYFLSFYVNENIEFISQDKFNLILSLFMLVITIANILNVIIQISKTIVGLEKNKPNLNIKEWQDTFFLILVFFIGIWVVQPRINKIFSKI